MDFTPVYIICSPRPQVGKTLIARLLSEFLLLKNGRVQAFEDRCAHQGVPLSLGRLHAGVLTCGAHEWQYDARTGQGINPSSAKLSRFPVEIRNGEIWIDVDDPLDPAGDNPR